jgi:hypothetical protein
MANEFAGSALYLSWVHSGGTTVLNTDFRTVSFTPTLELIDATAGADAYRQSIASFSSANFTFSGIFPSNGTAIMQALKEGTTGTITYSPAGTATNSPKIIMPAICEGATYSQPYNDIVEISASWASFNGTITYGNH